MLYYLVTKHVSSVYKLGGPQIMGQDHWNGVKLNTSANASWVESTVKSVRDLSTYTHTHTYRSNSDTNKQA